jgi:hypothetical protein
MWGYSHHEVAETCAVLNDVSERFGGYGWVVPFHERLNRNLEPLNP